MKTRAAATAYDLPRGWHYDSSPKATAETTVLATPIVSSPRRPRRPGHNKQQLSARASVASAWVGLAGAVAFPIVVWHGTIATMADSFRLNFGYLVTGWSGYLLLVVALALLVPVALSVGPRSVVNVRSRRALLSWGVVLYLLGTALSTQVAAIAG